MTHDLLRNVIVECRLSASSVVITDLLDNTFYARIELKDQNEEPVMLDARPSDAIALALRLDCPIFVEQKVIDLSASSTQTDPEPDESTPVTEDWPDLIG
jgi:bifunctional DNase/RNase